MNELLEITIRFLSELDVKNLLAIGTIFWIFNSNLNKKFEKIDQRFEKIDQQFEKIEGKMDQGFKEVNKRFEKMEEKLEKMNQDIKELRTSVNRMEGAFYAKECCMLKTETKDKNTG